MKIKKSFSVILIIVVTVLFSSNLIAEEIHLKDGSIIKGKILNKEGDIWQVQTQSLNNLQVAASEIHYEGKNYNNGLGIYFTNIGSDSNSNFSSGQMFSMGSAAAYDEK